MVSHAEIKAWVDAANALGADPQATCLCPARAAHSLRCEDIALASGKVVGR